MARLVIKDPKTPGAVTIAKAGIYQVDLQTEKPSTTPADVSKLSEGLTGLVAERRRRRRDRRKAVKVDDSPVGKAVSLSGDSDGLVVPRKSIPTDDAQNVGEGDFTVARVDSSGQAETGGLVSLGNADRSQGWFLDIAEQRRRCDSSWPPAGLAETVEPTATPRFRPRPARFATTPGSMSRWSCGAAGTTPAST